MSRVWLTASWRTRDAFAGLTAVALFTRTDLMQTIFSRLKSREGTRLLWLRAGVASVLSQIVDTLLFITISFYGLFPIGNLLVGQMLAKIVLSAIFVAPLVYGFVAVARKLDGTSVAPAAGDNP